MGAIGLREVPRALRFLRWALPDQRVNIGASPDTPKQPQGVLTRLCFAKSFALRGKGALMQTYCLRAQNT